LDWAIFDLYCYKGTEKRKIFLIVGWFRPFMLGAELEGINFALEASRGHRNSLECENAIGWKGE